MGLSRDQFEGVLTPEQHVERLGRELGMSATVGHMGKGHALHLEDNGPVGHLIWHGPEASFLYKPGEVKSVDVVEHRRREGIATAMVETATRIAEQHPEYAAPAHSGVLSKAGAAFSESVRARRA